MLHKEILNNPVSPYRGETDVQHGARDTERLDVDMERLDKDTNCLDKDTDCLDKASSVESVPWHLKSGIICLFMYVF